VIVLSFAKDNYLSNNSKARLAPLADFNLQLKFALLFIGR